MVDQRLKVNDLDPFEFMLLYRGLKKMHTAWLNVIALVVVLMVFFATCTDGTVGAFRDFQFWADIQRVLGIATKPPSPPDFPFIRDVTSWFLLVIVISGALLLHRQWQYASRCLSSLAKNGAIVPRTQPVSNVFSRVLRIDKIISGAPPEQTFNVLVDRVVFCLSRRSAWLAASMIVTSLILTELLVLGQQHGLFQALAPHGLTPGERQVWLNQAYESWWASRYHVFGYLIYQVLALFGIFVILNFDVVGVAIMYVIIAMHFLMEPRADWLNRDGRFGWSPVARVYRIAIWANALLGAALTAVLLTLGIHNYNWVAVLVIVYMIFMPMFILTPWLVFRHVEVAARTKRISEIEEVMTSRGCDINDVEAAAPFIAEIERCHKAKISPLRLGAVPLSTYIILVIMPVLLAAAQIFFPIWFGHH